MTDRIWEKKKKLLKENQDNWDLDVSCNAETGSLGTRSSLIGPPQRFSLGPGQMSYLAEHPAAEAISLVPFLKCHREISEISHLKFMK